jgi:hypothetical protein
MSDTDIGINLAAVPEHANSLFLYRSGYVRADRPDDYQPQPVTARAVTVEGTAPFDEQAHAVFTNAANEFEQHLDSIQTDRYSPAGLQEQIANFATSPAGKSVDDIVEQARQHADAADAQVDTIRRGLSSDGDTAAELRATRYWSRTQRALDSITDTGRLLAAANNLISAAPREELGTLLQELGPYLTSRGTASTDWIDAALAQAVPEYGAAKEEVVKANKLRDIAVFNANLLRDRFTKTAEPGAYRRPILVNPAVLGYGVVSRLAKPLTR